MRRAEVLRSRPGVYGFKAQLASAARCQRSHLSLVLAEKAHFSAEQAIGVADFLELSWKEKSFLLLLVNYARASTSELKTFVKLQIENSEVFTKI